MRPSVGVIAQLVERRVRKAPLNIEKPVET